MPEREAVQRAEALLREDYKSCFQGPSGDRVLADLARLGRMGETTFVPGDPGYSAFREGMRAVVLHIFDAVGLLDLGKWADQFKEES